MPPLAPSMMAIASRLMHLEEAELLLQRVVLQDVNQISPNFRGICFVSPVAHMCAPLAVTTGIFLPPPLSGVVPATRAGGHDTTVR